MGPTFCTARDLPRSEERTLILTQTGRRRCFRIDPFRQGTTSSLRLGTGRSERGVDAVHVRRVDIYVLPRRLVSLVSEARVVTVRP